MDEPPGPCVNVIEIVLTMSALLLFGGLLLFGVLDYN